MVAPTSPDTRESSAASEAFGRLGRRVCFGGFELDRLTESLHRDGETIAVPSRAVAVLSALLEKPGAVVSKAALLEAAWPDVHVTESSLADAISQLRQALGDEAQNPRFVQTVHRRGYRFCGELELSSIEGRARQPAAAESPGRMDVAAPTESATPAAAHETELPTDRRRLWAALGACLLLAGLASWAISGSMEERSRQPAESMTLPRVELSEPIPDGLWLDVLQRSLAIAPDGSVLTVALFEQTDFALWQRDRHRSGLRRLAGTEGASSPGYHPDGSLFFLRQGRIEQWTLGATAPSPVLAAPEASSLHVASDGSLLLTHANASRLSRALPPYRQWIPIATLDREKGDIAFSNPTLTSTERIRVLRWRGAPERSVWVELDPGSDSRPASETELGPGPIDSIAVKDRWLWATRGQIDSGRQLGVSEGAVANSLWVDNRSGRAQFAATDRDLVFLAAEGRSRLRILLTESDLATERRTLTEGPFTGVVASPDGQRLALVREEGDARDLYSLDIDSGREHRHTHGAVIADVAFLSAEELLFLVADGQVHRLDFGDGTHRPLFTLPGSMLGAELADGSFLVAAPDEQDRLRLVRARAGSGPGSEDPSWRFEPEPRSPCRGNELRPRLSPDGHLLAFLCDADERLQLFLVAMDADGQPRPESMTQVTHDEPGLLFFDWHGEHGLGLITLDLEVRFATAGLGPSPGTLPRIELERNLPLGPWSAAFPRVDGSFVTARLGALEDDRARPVLRWIHGWQSPAPGPTHR